MIGHAKLKREAGRVWKQIGSVQSRFVARIVGAWWERARKSRLHPESGLIKLRPNVAVVVVYQPAGCAESLFETLEHIVDAGFAPLVVCNSGVKQGDKSRMMQRAWKIMERPNIGYDFGGYRDGIWMLSQLGVDPDRLLCVNDTMWFPAVRSVGTIQRLVGLDADYAALCNFVYRPKSGRKDSLVRRTYAASFCFMLSRTAFQSNAFQDFWKNMPLYAVKPHVVERGEVGFSRAMAAAEFPPTVLHDHQSIRKRVSKMDPPEVIAFLRRLPVLNERIRPAYETLLAKLECSPEDRADIKKFVDDLLSELNPWDSLVYNGLILGWTDFVKKSNLKNSANAQRFLDLAEIDGLTLAPTVETEITRLASR